MKCLIVITMFTIICVNNKLYTQCGCMSSMSSGLLSPSSLSQAGTLREGILLFNLLSNYTAGNKEYSSNKVVPNTTVREFWNSSASFRASYGITKKLTGTLGINYILQNNIKTYIFNYKSNGWNSGQIGAKYNLLFNPKSNYEITALVDLSIPLQTVSDTTYMYLQPTSGAIAYSLGVFYHKGFSELELDFFSTLTSTFWLSNKANYQFGKTHTLIIAVTKPVIKQLSIGITTSFVYKDKDNLNGLIQNNSGFKNINIYPQVAYFWDDLSLGINSELPIYNEYFGSQIAKSFSIGLNLQYKLDTN